MTQIQFSEPLEHIVERIFLINKSWKIAQELFGVDHSCTRNFRELKACLQIRLLRSYPEDIDLVIDRDESERVGEDIFSVRLKTNQYRHRDAAHLPVRIARKLLTIQEINHYLHRKAFQE